MSDPVVLLSTGDVIGPAGGVTDGSMVLFDGTTGKKIKGNNAVVTAAGLAILDDVDNAAQRTTLGLGNVNNTTDLNKPISTATQTALNLKAPLVSPALTGVPTAPTAATSSNDTTVATTAFSKAAIEAAKTTSETDSTAGALLKVGDFGIGRILTTNNANNIPLGGSVLLLAPPFTNGPLSNYYTLISNNGSDNYSSQIAIPFHATNAPMHIRTQSDGTWGAWRLVGPGLGAEQTWQDVTGSRASGVVYTNTTGRPIQVTVNVNDSGGGAWNFVLNGTALSWNDQGGSTDFASFIIPNGNTYQVNRGAHTIAKWMELR